MKLSNILPKLKRLRTTPEEVDTLKAHCRKLEAEQELSRNQILSLSKQNDLILDRFYRLNEAANLLLYRDFLSKRTPLKDFHPLVSIIIPAYNASKYLSEAINCALDQSYDNIEIIVVNDGSNDNEKTEKVALSYKKKIRYYKKKNGGVSSALNYGIKRMNGEYFVWLSHDDLITRDHVENLVHWVSYKEAKYEIPFTSFYLVDSKQRYMYDGSRNAQLFLSDFKLSIESPDSSLLLGEINGGSVLIPKEAFETIGLFDETLRIAQERDLWDRLSVKYHFVCIPFNTAFIRIHNEQVSSKKEQVEKETTNKVLEILDGLSQKRIAKSFIDKAWLLLTLQRFYSNNSRDTLAKEIKKRIDRL